MKPIQWSIAVATLILALWTDVGTAADAAIHACVDRNRQGNPHGLVRMVLPTERCHRGEVRVVWNVQGPAGGGGLAVYDSHGVKVGNVVSFDDRFQPVVLPEAPLPLVPLRVFDMHLGGSQSFLYRDYSCGTQPYMAPPPSGLGPSPFYPLSWAATDLPGGALGAWLYGPSEADAQGLGLNSVRHPDGSCQMTVEHFTVVPAEPQVDLGALFTPPFELR